MGVEFLQSNMTAGELTPDLHARTDISKYAHGVADATNMIILPYGGLRRRPGMSKIPYPKKSEEVRIVPFVFNQEQDYLIVMTALSIDILKDGVLQSTEVTPYTLEQLFEVDVIQSADTMIMTHQEHAPQQLQRQGSDTAWLFSAITFVFIPTFDFGSGVENAWSVTRGWPRTCSFFGARLWFAGSTQRPISIWGSKINGFFDFGLGDGSDDLGIDDIIDSNEFNVIQRIFGGRTLQVFTTGAEFINPNEIITPSNNTFKRQTGYGSKVIKPILIDGATLFIDSSQRTVRQFLFNFNEDGYTSVNASLLSSHLITNVKAMDAIKGTIFDVGDYVYIVNEDGTVAVLNTMRNEEIQGWTHWVTDGLVEDVAVLNKEVYFVVQREGERFIELLTEDTYTDHNVLIKGIQPTTANVIRLTDNVIRIADNVVHTDISTGTAVTEIVTDFDGVFENTFFKVIADFSIMPDAQYEGTSGSNKFTITRDAYRLEVGLNFNTNVTTLPLATTTQKGNTLHRRKRVVKVDINVLDSLGVYARNRFSGDRMFTVVLDKAPTPFTGFKEMYLLGYQRLAEIEISQNEPLPFILRGLSYEVEY